MPVASFVATGTACGRLRSRLARKGVSFPPDPPSFPQRAFFWRIKRYGNTTAFPAATVSRDTPYVCPVTRFPLSCSPEFSSARRYFCHCRPGSMLSHRPAKPHSLIFSDETAARQGHTLRPAVMQRWRGRGGDPGRPKGGRSAKAGADIAPATGRGRFAPTPRATRGGRGTVQLKRQFSRYRQAGSTGVQGV